MTAPFEVPNLDPRQAERHRSIVLDWLQLGSLSSAAYRPPLDRVSSQFKWLELRSLSGFWEESGAGAASSAVATMLATTAHMNAETLVVVNRSGSQLSYWVGVADAAGAGRQDVLAATLRSVMATALPGSDVALAAADQVAAVLTRVWAQQGRTALVGVPRSVRYPPAVPVLEQLAGSQLSEWTLSFWGEPFPRAALRQRYNQLCDLRSGFAAELATSRRVNALETRQSVDPLLSEIEGILEQEQKRALGGTWHGTFAGQFWINADSQPAADALAAVAIGAVAPKGAAAFPLQSFATGQPGQPAVVPLVPADCAALLTPPLHDVTGLVVSSWARFDAEPEPVAAATGGRAIRLGVTPGGRAVDYPVDLLTRHIAVTGMTGSGKSAFVRSLLGDLAVPHLVIEPTKGEYADEMQARGGLVWRIGDPGSPFRLNPCEVPAGTPLSLHIDLLMGLMQATLGLFPPLPFVLEMGLRRAYEKRGWDQATGGNAFGALVAGFPQFPTISEVLTECLALVAEFGYVGEIRHNVTAALRARLGSLSSGPKGLAFDTEQPFDADGLLAVPAVVNLDLIGNDEEKAFATGLLLIRLLEARRGASSQQLKHVTVVEEAHRIFRRPDQATPAEGVPTNDFASETLANLLSEVRSAGEGIIVVDQSPRRLADAALANSALKVAFRCTFGDDLDRLQSALNLSSAQRSAVVGLPTFDAIVFWEGMDKPVRITAAATHARTAPAGFGSGATPAPATLSSMRISQFADAWLASDDAGRERWLFRMRRDALRLVPAAVGPREGEALVAQSVAAAQRRAVERALRRRRMPLADRIQLLAEPAQVGRETLLDGTAPFVGCALVCPQGGCPTGDVAAPSAEALRAAGVGDRTEPGQAAALMSHINDQLMRHFGTPPQELPAPTQLCVAVQALEGTRGELALGELVDWLESEPSGVV